MGQSENNKNDNNKIEVMESVYAKNEALAGKLNKELTAKRVFCVNVMGSPGAGKTSSLVQIIRRLSAASYASFVIEGDIESDIDARKLASLGISAAQINTGGECHLDSPLIAEAFAGNPFENGFLFIENVGNLVCPAEFLIGEHIKMLISSVTEGSDKPYKYPLAFEKADAILVNKWDMRKYAEFDAEFYISGVKKLNARAPVFFVSAKTGDGFGEVAEWLVKRAGTVIKK